MTIAWGEKERRVPKRARRRDELPAHVRWLTLPDCGHLPFWDAPELIVSTIIGHASDWMTGADLSNRGRASLGHDDHHAVLRSADADVGGHRLTRA